MTASRRGEAKGDSPASIAVLDQQPLERLGEPMLADVVALTPSASLAASGPAGSQAQLRIRGSEANHTLLFIDGIRANDPAAGNEPRFELLNADLADSIEVVRGPQSALWGSEAIGGVVALRANPAGAPSARLEAGSFGYRRASGRVGMVEGPLSIGFAAGFQGASGINAFAGGPGDRDGYANRALRLRADWQKGGATLIASGFALTGRSEFDGLDPVTFVRADTADESRNRLAAVRLGAGWKGEGWRLSLASSLLASRNRNLVGDTEQNRTQGRRQTLGLDVGREFTLGDTRHSLTVATEWSRERFVARDVAFGGLTDQRRRRDQSALMAEWHGEAGPAALTFALRRDRFSDFADATTARVGGLVDMGQGWQAAASYGSGIAQPTFFDLYGFFPGSFAGNSALGTERSRGGEFSLRRTEGRLTGAVTWFRQRLTDEIVERFDPATFLATTVNAAGASRRRGLELELRYAASPALALSGNATLLDADEPASRELRRPRRSGAVRADGAIGRWSYGASLAHVGRRLDRDFDLFPSRLVRLDPSWMANARVAFEVSDRLQLFTRLSNVLDSKRQDVVGYRREGRGVHAGIRLAAARR